MASQLVEAAKNAINQVFSDRTVSRAETRDRLEELMAEIETCLDALDEDDENEE